MNNQVTREFYVGRRLSDGKLTNAAKYTLGDSVVIIDSEMAIKNAEIIGKYDLKSLRRINLRTTILSIFFPWSLIALFWSKWWIPVIGFGICKIGVKVARRLAAGYALKVLLKYPESNDDLRFAGILAPVLSAEDAIKIAAEKLKNN